LKTAAAHAPEAPEIFVVHKVCFPWQTRVGLTQLLKALPGAGIALNRTGPS
jgi:hypothetical protein